MNVTLRPEAAEDQDFLRSLILATVAAELGADAWPEPMRSHLLGIQYKARRAGLRQAESRVIQRDGQDCGWLVIATGPEEIRLVEIMIAPDCRGRGIGSAVLRDVQAAAAEAGKPVRLHVNVTNTRAVELYRRLGFRRIGGDDVQHFMERPVL